MIPYDLLICLLAIIVASAMLFIVGTRVGRNYGKATSAALALAGVVVLIVYGIWFDDDPLLTHILPVANVLILGNPQLFAAAVVAGVAWSSLISPTWQRLVLIIPLIGIGFWREIGPLLGRPPIVGPSRWVDGICRQTSTSACSAAAAATLLSIHGIHRTEAEMVRDCLTHTAGTTTLGLYRGLKIATANSDLDVYAGTPATASIDRWPLPAVVTISLPGVVTKRFDIRVGHSIVVVNRTIDGGFEIADPFAGRQHWTRNQLIAAYGGDLFALRSRLP